MHKESKQHIMQFDPLDIEYHGFGSIASLQVYMRINDIPDDAVIHYAGCGTHNIKFVWEIEVADPLDSFETTGEDHGV